MGTQRKTSDQISTDFKVDREAVRAYLTEMYLDVPGLLQIWTVPGKGAGAFFTTDEDGIEQAVDHVACEGDFNGESGVFARITTMKNKPSKAGSRGAAADSQSFIALWTDLDYGTDGHANGQKLPPDMASAQQVYDRSGLPEPSIVVHSGGGLYHIVKLAEPVDITDADVRSRVNALSRRWQHKVKATAETMGYKYGTGVSDLARVLRIPGTVNAKDWNNRRRAATLYATGARYTLEELEAYCPAPPMPERRTLVDTGEPAKDARSRLAHHLAELRATTFERNNALNKLAFMSFQYVGAGQLDEAEVEREFIAAGIDIGLEQRDVEATVNSAKRGISQPFVWKTFTRPERTDMWAGEQHDEAGHVIAPSETPVITEEPKPREEEPPSEPPAPPPPPVEPPGDGRPEPAPGPLPIFDITNERDGLHNLTEAVTLGCLPEVYVRDGRLVHVSEISGTHTGQDDFATFRATGIDASYLRSLTGHHLVTTKMNAKGNISTTLPTKALCDAVLARTYWPDVPRLRDVVRMPFVRRDGTICQTFGYDEATGMWLACPEGLRPVPENPSTQDIDEARDLIFNKVLRDFPWTSRADRANYIALLFTPMLREVFDSLSPFGVISASAPSSGKTLLTDLISCIHGGRMGDISKNDEELRKKITSVFMDEMVPTYTFDNVGMGHTLSSPILAQLLTQRIWTDRILGGNQILSRVNDKLWMATGNNIQLGGDMGSRSVLVRLDPRMERPEERDTKQFAVGNLDMWMRQPENQAHMMWALLVMVRAWATAGMPKGDQEMRNFAPWVQYLGGLLEFHGIEGLRENKDEVGEADEEKIEWSLFLQIWNERHGDNWITASQLLADYQNTLFSTSIGGVDPWQGTFPLGPNSKTITTKGLGKKCQYYRDRPANGWVLRYRAVPGRAALWRVERMPDAPPPPHRSTPVPEQRTQPAPVQAILTPAAPTHNGSSSPIRTHEVRGNVDRLLRNLRHNINITYDGTQETRQ